MKPIYLQSNVLPQPAYCLPLVLQADLWRWQSCKTNIEDFDPEIHFNPTDWAFSLNTIKDNEIHIVQQYWYNQNNILQRAVCELFHGL